MRRSEFAIDDKEDVGNFLAEMTFGFLGTIGEDGRPHVTPLNFVYHKGSIYFHGSKIGQKMEDLRHDRRVCFAVAKEYALIPSYFSDPTFACPATSYFKSAVVKGTAQVVDVKRKRSPPSWRSFSPREATLRSTPPTMPMRKD